ncbi:U4/U6.U5 small nuclear ribonucleoprotein 27 kDa protein [Quillaja saponaria]|uniref:U4/U6.U5 small nuclear ribonucleoprotein 27 kDa protein n=1 Tax=Quillaja saponaria TaxID=32244 RepID=A0AAD7LCW1_QUISA|nr:U4/U6.U5 small nuclear ribonucleoprotein 27 kDa protein [Quillaja saponaria]
MKKLGIPVGFYSTKGKPVPGPDLSGVKAVTKRQPREYMNRRGGFNLPLPAERSRGRFFASRLWSSQPYPVLEWVQVIHFVFGEEMRPLKHGYGPYGIFCAILVVSGMPPVLMGMYPRSTNFFFFTGTAGYGSKTAETFRNAAGTLGFFVVEHKGKQQLFGNAILKIPKAFVVFIFICCFIVFVCCVVVVICCFIVFVSCFFVFMLQPSSPIGNLLWIRRNLRWIALFRISWITW